MKNNTVVITGVSGQDGAYLSKYLTEKDYDVIGVVRKNYLTQSKSSNILPIGLSYLNVKKITIIKIDLEKKEEVDSIIKKFKPFLFFNLAAQSSVGNSFNDPYSSLSFNYKSVLNIVDAIKNFSPKTRFFNASSSEIYGNVSYSDLPISIDTKQNPVSPYGFSKLHCNNIVEYYRNFYGLFLVNGITFNHESCLRKENFVFNKIFSHLVNLKKGYSSILKLGDINVVREWGYAPKYIEAMYMILVFYEPQDVLICNGKPISLKEIIKKAYKFIGFDYNEFVEVDKSLLRPKELNAIYGDSSQITNIIDWDYSLDYDDLIEKLIKDYFNYYEWAKRSSC